jgi:hypothetical protein
MQPRIPSIPFPWAWWAFSLGDVRPCDGTYCRFPYETLPPIPALDGTLNWLGPLGRPESPDESPHQRARRERDLAEARDKAHSLATQAEQFGLRLPDAFTRILAAPELLDRIPEYAGCWFSLYHAPLVPLSGSEDGFVVRFLNDQQDCILWYLYISRHGAEAVLAVTDPFPKAPSPYLELLVTPDEDGPLSDAQQHAVLASTYACAPSFESFIYRRWLEATIYMKLNEFDSEPLTEEERRYLAHYQQAQPGL